MAKHYRYQKSRKQKRTTLQYLPATMAIFAIVYFFGLPILKSYLSASNAVPQISQANLNGVPQAQATEVIPQINAPMPWPEYGFAGYGVPKDKLYASSTDDEAVPIASLAKLITVLAVLEKKPLKQGERGPGIILDKYDADLVGEYARKSGTYTTVLEGMEISQYQALQAILMVSSNNMSDSLARWAFGSVDEYVIYANKMLKDYGLFDTIVADDASGYSPNTISTPKDMTKIGQLFMKHPVLREITNQNNATIPVVGYIANNNDFMNDNEITGIKVGNTDEAGKCFIAATIREDADGSEEVSVAVVLGATDYYSAAEDTKTILNAGNKEHDVLAMTSKEP